MSRGVKVLVLRGAWISVAEFKAEDIESRIALGDVGNSGIGGSRRDMSDFRTEVLTFLKLRLVTVILDFRGFSNMMGSEKFNCLWSEIPGRSIKLIEFKGVEDRMRSKVLPLIWVDDLTFWWSPNKERMSRNLEVTREFWFIFGMLKSPTINIGDFFRVRSDRKSEKFSRKALWLSLGGLYITANRKEGDLQEIRIDSKLGKEFDERILGHSKSWHRIPTPPPRLPSGRGALRKE